MNPAAVANKTTPRVLVVDDERGPRESLKYLLGEDYHIDTCDRVGTALAKITPSYYDVIILDIRLPEMNGIEGLARIRAIDPDAAIIMLTGYGKLETAQEAIKLGASDYLTKPFDIHQMSDTVKRHAENVRIRRQKAVFMKEVQKMNDILKDQLEERETLASWGKASARLVHDLSSPLTAILGYSSLLLHEVKNAQVEGTDLDSALNYAEILERNANYCRDLARAWKDISKTPFTCESMNPAEIVRKLKTDQFFNSDNIVLTGDTEARAEGSAREISRVFQNLIRNGLEARQSPEHTPTVTVDIRKQGEYLACTVRDSGCGMTQEDMQRMQQGNFTTKGSGGTGLGFIICRRIIEAHNGTIQVQSTPRQGTRITFTLKACPAP